jgi:hypothetical protein
MKSDRFLEVTKPSFLNMQASKPELECHVALHGERADHHFASLSANGDVELRGQTSLATVAFGLFQLTLISGLIAVCGFPLATLNTTRIPNGNVNITMYLSPSADVNPLWDTVNAVGKVLGLRASQNQRQIDSA